MKLEEKITLLQNGIAAIILIVINLSPYTTYFTKFAMNIIVCYFHGVLCYFWGELSAVPDDFKIKSKKNGWSDIDFSKLKAGPNTIETENGTFIIHYLNPPKKVNEK